MNPSIQLNSIVRINLWTEKGYRPYCGNDISRDERGGCHNPRSNFDGEQFVCPHCGWKSQFPIEFILEYKRKWGIE